MNAPANAYRTRDTFSYFRDFQSRGSVVPRVRTSNMYMLILRMYYFMLSVIANGRSRQLKADIIGY